MGYINNFVSIYLIMQVKWINSQKIDTKNMAFQGAPDSHIPTEIQRNNQKLTKITLQFCKSIKGLQQPSQCPIKKKNTTAFKTVGNFMAFLLMLALLLWFRGVAVQPKCCSMKQREPSELKQQLSKLFASSLGDWFLSVISVNSTILKKN